MPRPRDVVFLSLIAALAGCGSQTASFPVRTYPMGEKVSLGSLNYEVVETQYLTQIGEGASARIPQERYFLVKVSVTNSGSDVATVPAFDVENDAGKVYTEISNGEGVPSWIGYLRSLKPAESAHGNALFDAPPGHYKLRVKDEGGERAALVDIPLNFNAETPDVPTPGDPSRKQP